MCAHTSFMRCDYAHRGRGLSSHPVAFPEFVLFTVYAGERLPFWGFEIRLLQYSRYSSRVAPRHISSHIGPRRRTVSRMACWGGAAAYGRGRGVRFTFSWKLHVTTAAFIHVVLTYGVHLPLLIFANFCLLAFYRVPSTILLLTYLTGKRVNRTSTDGPPWRCEQ